MNCFILILLLHPQLSVYIYVFTFSTFNVMYVQRAPDCSFALGLKKIRAGPACLDIEQKKKDIIGC